MVFYGSDFYVLNNKHLSEDMISEILDRLIVEYRVRYFSSTKSFLADLDARWCIFYSSDNTPKYFYCFTIVEFTNPTHLNHFKIKNPEMYQEMLQSGFTIKINEIESRLLD